MQKKIRLYVGIALVIQAFSFFVMFIILCVKKKSIAAAFLAVAAMEGAVGGYLIYQEKKAKKLSYGGIDDEGLFDNNSFDFDDSMINSDIYGNDLGTLDVDILRDEDASEADFQ